MNLFRGIDNGAMNPVRDDACSYVRTSANTLGAFKREWGNTVEPLKKPTQVLPISTV
jgi:hypothetical protein